MSLERSIADKVANCPDLNDPLDTAWEGVKKGNFSEIWSCSNRDCEVKITSRRRPVGRMRGLQLINPEKCLQLDDLS